MDTGLFVETVIVCTFWFLAERDTSKWVREQSRNEGFIKNPIF